MLLLLPLTRWQLVYTCRFVLPKRVSAPSLQCVVLRAGAANRLRSRDLRSLMQFMLLEPLAS